MITPIVTGQPRRLGGFTGSIVNEGQPCYGEVSSISRETALFMGSLLSLRSQDSQFQRNASDVAFLSVVPHYEYSM